MRKLLSVLLVLAMVLGLASTAFAATDVTGTKYDAAVTRLNALSILKGYSDGSFKPTNNITRAEFAAVAVRALGLEDAAKNTVGLTKFKDVPGTHWAAGYINVAVGRGVIKGYPDGTFKPEANVTNAEAMAMLIRVLGYEPSVVGEWPMNYVSKAAEIGLTKGIALNTDLAATRGDVALMTNNALTINLMVQSTYGTLSGYTVSGQTLLVDKLGCTELEDVVVNATPLYDRVGLKANEVKLGANTYTFDASLNVEPLIGHTVDAWAKNGNVFYMLDKTTASQIVSFTVKSANATDIVFDGADSSTATDDVTYVVNGTEKVFYNHAANTMAGLNVADPNPNLTGAAVTLILDDTNKVAFVIALEYAPSYIVTKVDTTAQTVKVVKTDGTESTLTLKDTKFTIIDATGAIKSLADVAKNDVLSVATAGTQTWIRFVRNSVAGDVTKVTTTDDSKTSKYSIYIGGTAYSLASNAGTRETGPAYKTIVPGTPGAGQYGVDSLIGAKGTFYLDASGKIRLADLTKAATTTNYAFVDTAPWPVPSSTGTVRYVKILKLDGTKSVLPIDVADETDVDTVGKFFSYTLDGDTIDGVDAVNFAGAPNSTGAATVSVAYDRITIGAATYVVTADTQIYTQLAALPLKPTEITWATAQGATGDGGAHQFTVTSILANADYPSRAAVIIFTNGTFTSSDTSAVLLKNYYSQINGTSTERHMVVDLNGTEKDYVIATGTDVSAFDADELGTLTFDATGKVSGVTVLNPAGAGNEAGVTIDSGELDTDAGILKGVATYFKTEDTVVYDVTGTSVKVDWTSLANGQKVDIYTDGAGNLTYVVILEK